MPPAECGWKYGTTEHGNLVPLMFMCPRSMGSAELHKTTNRKPQWGHYTPPCVPQVRTLEGDLMQPGLGFDDVTRQHVLSTINFVIHSAASIELEADVQNTLKCNYLGSKCLLQLAAKMTSLKSYVHVSTAYVNVNLPENSSIDERLYPLCVGSQPVSHEGVVEDLLSLGPGTANVRVRYNRHMRQL